MGKKTAGRIAEHGLVARQNVLSSAMNSEALLVLPSLLQVANERVLIFRGVGGRPALAEVLTERGARVELCELYWRQMPTDATEQIRQATLSPGYDIVTLFSGETLENYTTLVKAIPGLAWQDVPLLVPGERITELAHKLGFKTVATAANATEDDMWRALTRFLNHQV